MLVLIILLPIDRFERKPPPPMPVTLIPPAEFEPPKEPEPPKPEPPKPEPPKPEPRIPLPHVAAPKPRPAPPAEITPPEKTPEVSKIPPVAPPPAGRPEESKTKEGALEQAGEGGEAKKEEKVSLYDPSVLERYSLSPEKKDRGITLDSEELAHITWGYRLSRQMETEMGFPRYSIYSSIIRTDPFIKIVILKDGSLGEVRLLRTFGTPTRDRAALAAIKRIAPFPPLPKKWGKESHTIYLEFEPR